MVNLIWEFSYENERRIVVITQDKQPANKYFPRLGERTLTGWDFTAEGFRSFKWSKIENLKLVTKFKIFETNDELGKEYEDGGASVFHHSDIGVMYIVVLKD